MNERVKEVRKTLGLTLEKFGIPLGVTKSSLSLIESGKNNLSEQMLKAICREYNVHEDWLRTGVGEMFIELSKDEQIATYIGELAAKNGTTFEKSFVTALVAQLSLLDEQGWQILHDFLIGFWEKYNKDKEEKQDTAEEQEEPKEEEQE